MPRKASRRSAPILTSQLLNDTQTQITDTEGHSIVVDHTQQTIDHLLGIVEQLREQLLPTIYWVGRTYCKYANISYWSSATLKENSKLLYDAVIANIENITYDMGAEEECSYGTCREDIFEEMVDNDMFRNELNVGWYQGTNIDEIKKLPVSVDELIPYFTHENKIKCEGMEYFSEVIDVIAFNITHNK